MIRDPILRSVKLSLSLLVLAIGIQEVLGPSVAAAPMSPVTCDSLQATLSPDKTFYTFTVTSSGNASVITGYTFNFGDNQLYTVTFNTSSKQNRHTSSVTHTYRRMGTYHTSVRADITTEHKASSVSSSSCQTNIAIGSPDSTLPNTGAGNTIGLFALTSVAGASMHQLWRRRHLASPRNN
jgi:hypothetical protein